jgi:hypothetical protein
MSASLWDLNLPGGAIPDVEEQRRIMRDLLKAIRAAAREASPGTCAWKAWYHRSPGSTYLKIWASHASYTLRLSGHRTSKVFHADLRGVPSSGRDLFLQPSEAPVSAGMVLQEALAFFALHQVPDLGPDPISHKEVFPRRAGEVFPANSEPVNPRSLVVPTGLHLLEGVSNGW